MDWFRPRDSLGSVETRVRLLVGRAARIRYSRANLPVCEFWWSRIQTSRLRPSSHRQSPFTASSFLDSTSLDGIVNPEVWLRIPWAYSIAMLLSVAIFFLVAKLLPIPRSQTGLPRFEKWTLVGAAFIGGTLGGKLPFVLAQKKIGRAHV